jgi:hypothetical protein
MHTYHKICGHAQCTALKSNFKSLSNNYSLNMQTKEVHSFFYVLDRNMQKQTEGTFIPTPDYTVSQPVRPQHASSLP